ncbi:F-box/kelch-repeat protein At3g23880-like [Mercurialis annua]|uniref:F-box/kelch-repeat protein At3g23880-like n=1 Tax=Mercurialis annua TaxID=3986 RepID=UPI00215F6091|nr:F-box/kelch-repeat protein At3g23880-like [Mercurialis annua]
MATPPEKKPKLDLDLIEYSEMEAPPVKKAELDLSNYSEMDTPPDKKAELDLSNYSEMDTPPEKKAELTMSYFSEMVSPPEKKEESKPRGFVHEAMIEAILAKVPVKSLVRFKSVSKFWGSLISDSTFPNLRSIFPHNVLVLNENSHFITADRAAKRLVTLNSPFATPHTTIMGSCGGLICISCTGNLESIIIWNPLTGKIREVPNPSCPLDSDDCSFGFGYKSSAKDYNIVLAVEERHSEDCFYSVNVFSLKEDRWEVVYSATNPKPEDTIVGEAGYGTRGTHIDGVLYWNIQGVVHSFSLESKMFSILPPPRGEGHLSALDGLSFTDSSGIYTLNGFGAVDAWVNIIPFTANDVDVQPLHVTESDDMRPLYMDSERIIIAKRFLDDTFEDIAAISVPGGEIHTLFQIGEGRRTCDAITYLEDIVDPNKLISRVKSTELSQHSLVPTSSRS